jgi:hypothetical protein
MKLPFCSLREKRRLEKEIARLRWALNFWCGLASQRSRENDEIQAQLNPPPTQPEEANRLIQELAKWEYADMR